MQLLLKKYHELLSTDLNLFKFKLLTQQLKIYVLYLSVSISCISIEPCVFSVDISSPLPLI